MKQNTLFIEGMTCKNCERSVQEKLSGFKGLTNVEVSLEKARATFTTAQDVELSQLTDLLGEKYQLSFNAHPTTNPVSSKLRQLFPLFLILFYVTAGALFLSNGLWDDYFLSAFMGLFFIVFSFFKFLDYTSFPASFQQYDPIAKRSKLYAYLYPFIETLLGLCFLFQYAMDVAAGVTVVLLLATSWGVFQTLRNKQAIQCACLGTALKLPMTEATLIENFLMIVMALGMLLS